MQNIFYSINLIGCCNNYHLNAHAKISKIKAGNELGEAVSEMLLIDECFDEAQCIPYNSHCAASPEETCVEVRRQEGGTGAQHCVGGMALDVSSLSRQKVVTAQPVGEGPHSPQLKQPQK